VKTAAAGRAVGRRFVAADPGNAQWQRDLAAGCQRLAEARLRMGKTAQALTELRRGRDIMAALIATASRASLDLSPDLPQWSEDLDRFDARIAVLTGRTREQPATPAVASTGTPAAPVLVAGDLRKGAETLPPTDTKRAN